MPLYSRFLITHDEFDRVDCALFDGSLTGLELLRIYLVNGDDLRSLWLGAICTHTHTYTHRSYFSVLFQSDLQRNCWLWCSSPLTEWIAKNMEPTNDTVLMQQAYNAYMHTIYIMMTVQKLVIRFFVMGYYLEHYMNIWPWIAKIYKFDSYSDWFNF